jgi:hypothetical protein
MATDDTDEEELDEFELMLKRKGMRLIKPRPVDISSLKVGNINAAIKERENPPKPKPIKKKQKLERYLDTADGKFKTRLVGGTPPVPRFWPSKNMYQCAKSRAKRQNMDWNELDTRKAMRRYYQERADLGKINSPTSEVLALKGIDTTSWDVGDGKFIELSPNIKLVEAAKLKTEIPIQVPFASELKTDDSNSEIESEMKDMVPILADMTITEPKYENPEFKTQALKNLAAKGDISKQAKQKEEMPEPTGRHWKGEKVDARFSTKIVWSEASPGTRKDFFAWCNVFFLTAFNLGDNIIPLGKIHEKWCAIIEQSKKVCMLCPRDHYKTYLLNIAYILYHICELQDVIALKGILNISWDKILASETYGVVQRNLLENPRILSFYGYLIDDNRPKTQQKMFFKFQPIGSRPGLFCATFKSGSITGQHPAIAFLDDIEDEELPPNLMEKFKTIINIKLIPALGKKGRIIITGTLKGWNTKNDAYLWLKTKPTFQVYRFPAINKMPPMKHVKYRTKIVPLLDYNGKQMYNFETGEPEIRKEFEIVEIKNAHEYKTIYPERYDVYDLQEKKLELRDEEGTDDKFNSEYLLKPTDPTGRYFKYERLRPFQESGYTPAGFVEHTYKHHKHRYLWIDPGGEGDQAHGIAVGVMAYLNGKYYFLDFRVIKKPIHEAAKIICDMIILWKVDKWGCEGNFSQKAAYGNQIKLYVRKILEKKGKINLWSIPYIRSNTGEKHKRISTHMSMMLGPEDEPAQCYVNKNSEGYEDFINQYGYFGRKISNNNHDFDLLDCKASMKIHLFGASRPYGAAKR